MQELKTVADKISRVQAKVLRKLEDIHVTNLGTKCQILRITQSLPDDWGQTVEDLKDMIIDSVFITRPWSSSVELFQQLDQATQEADSSALNMWEFLPTKVKIPFSGDRDDVPRDLIKGDIIVEVLRDQYDTKIPIIYQVTRIYGAISVFTVCSKTYECALYRGTLSPNIQTAVNLYVDGIE